MTDIASNILKNRLLVSWRAADWTLMAAGSFVLGALGLLFGLFSDGEARRLFDSPDVVLVEGEVLQVFRTRHADRGALELWRFPWTVGHGTTWPAVTRRLNGWEICACGSIRTRPGVLFVMTSDP